MNRPREQPRYAAPLLRPTSRRKMAVLIGAVAVGYAGLNAFWLYLSTGDWFRLRPGAFAADFTSPVLLPDLFERTLNVLTHPAMIVVGGLLLGTLVLVPILVTILHRLWGGLALTAAVWVLGHAPAMALALAAGCVLASKTRLRRIVPFLAAIVGALPLGLYFYLFSSAGSGSVAVLPIQRWALRAPYLVAVLTAGSGFGVVLWLARASRYRPGLVWPVLSAVLALPACLFSWTIGRAELEYQLIAGPLAPGDAVFEPMDRKTWIASVGGQGLGPQSLLPRAQADLEDRKTDLQDRCRRFLRRFPRSRRAPAVQWVQAQCQSLQLDRPALEQGWVKSTAAHAAPVPNEEGLSPVGRAERSRETIRSAARVWERLLVGHAASPQAAMASWRLAELDLRQLALPGAGAPQRDSSREGTPASSHDANQLLRRADERLRAAERTLAGLLEQWRRQKQRAREEEIFTEAPSVPPHEYYEQVLLKVRRLLWLMRRNEVLSDPRSAEALGAFLQVNGYGVSLPAVAPQLYDLAGRYEDTPLAMNLKLAVALVETDPRRRSSQLIILADQDQDEDAAVEASYELGQLVLQRPELRALPDLKGPEEYFRFVRDAEGNPWKELAAQRLRLLEIASHPAASRPAPQPPSRPTG